MAPANDPAASGAGQRARPVHEAASASAPRRPSRSRESSSSHTSSATAAAPSARCCLSERGSNRCSVRSERVQRARRAGDSSQRARAAAKRQAERWTTPMRPMATAPRPSPRTALRRRLMCPRQLASAEAPSGRGSRPEGPTWPRVGEPTARDGIDSAKRRSRWNAMEAVGSKTAACMRPDPRAVVARSRAMFHVERLTGPVGARQQGPGLVRAAPEAALGEARLRDGRQTAAACRRWPRARRCIGRPPATEAASASAARRPSRSRRLEFEAREHRRGSSLERALLSERARLRAQRRMKRASSARAIRNGLQPPPASGTESEEEGPGGTPESPSRSNAASMRTRKLDPAPRAARCST